MFDPESLTPEERLGWTLAGFKQAAREVMARSEDRIEPD